MINVKGPPDSGETELRQRVSAGPGRDRFDHESAADRMAAQFAGIPLVVFIDGHRMPSGEILHDSYFTRQWWPPAPRSMNHG